jgi:hypothetical protein
LRIQGERRLTLLNQGWLDVKTHKCVMRALNQERQREAAPAEVAARVLVVVEPARRRRSFTEVLAAFMEERSIRWAELIGGLLILGCSIMASWIRPGCRACWLCCRSRACWPGC